MSEALAHRPVARPSPPGRARALSRAAGLFVALAALLVVTVLSVGVGAKTIPPGAVLHALLHAGAGDDAVIVWSLRVPRTLLGLAVGVALGAGGALMQALTRNPLADPGVLGVNAGASAAVVTGVGFFGIGSAAGYVWFALVGAAVSAVLVYALGSRGRAAATPVRLALAGAAINAVLLSFVQGVTVLDQRLLDQYRFWQVGALAGRPLDVLAATGPFLAAGALVALALGRPLNALALGEDGGRALGSHPGRTRAAGVLAVTLLCGAATAAAGPVTFVGLTVPHVARRIVGVDQRWIVPYSMLLAPILLLAADVLGRVLARPDELEVGIVTAFLGAPVFVAIARRSRLVPL